jgi:peroxisomal 3,2-trans-enoyl-CoA isomerase
VAAFRELNAHPDTVFTILTGEGRFFSAGADVKGRAHRSSNYMVLTLAPTATASERQVAWNNDAEKKLTFVTQFATGPYSSFMG